MSNLYFVHGRAGNLEEQMEEDNYYDFKTSLDLLLLLETFALFHWFRIYGFFETHCTHTHMFEAEIDLTSQGHPWQV